MVVFKLATRNWTLPELDKEKYEAAFEQLGVDVQAEFTKMVLWLEANKNRRPRSVKGIKTFITRWLNRASERAVRPGQRQQMNQEWKSSREKLNQEWRLPPREEHTGESLREQLIKTLKENPIERS